jgi:hypothetical protein
MNAGALAGNEALVYLTSDVQGIETELNSKITTQI